jgi:DNA-binding SARP family transcriptional activator
LAVEIRVLGPLEVAAGDRLLDVGGARLRVLFALLVAARGRVVRVGTLVEGLWGAAAPADAERTVRAYVSLLRKALRPADLIETRPPGYLLRVEPEAVDAAEFERLAAEGRDALAAGRAAAAARLLARALGLWRGEAYGEFAEAGPLAAERARLAALRLGALVDRVEADLAAGLGGVLVAELEALTAAHPGHERLWGQLMRALYRDGRQADALAAYARARAGLLESSGQAPSPALAAVQAQVLAHDPALLPAGPAPAVPAPATPAAEAPAQLPPGVWAFSGREEELAALDRLLAPGDRPPSVAVAAVSGTAGIGKTALALHWAHAVADRFPDGQLYVNLRGFDPGGPPLPAAAAIRRFLDAYGVPAARIPADLDSQSALYRSTLAGRRVLVVLDNAADAEQVRPLLPGTPTAVVLVTSRNPLAGLVAGAGAQPVPLGLLSDAEARDLLGHQLGAERLADDPAAVDEIIDRCARLPLALAIAAARAVSHPDFPLGAVAAELGAAELGDARDRLDALSGGDPATDVRAVFSSSYRSLSEPAARLFRLLGLHPGPDVTVSAAASLAGVDRADARRLLAEVTRASLLTEDAPGRYGYHDLLRAYAADLVERVDSPAQREAAVGRLMDHYLHSAGAADVLLGRPREPSPLPPRPALPGTAVEEFADRPAALAWLAAEHAGLVAALRLPGTDRQVWQLAWVLATYLDRRGHWPDLAAAGQAALVAARRLGELSGQAWAQTVIARSHLRRGGNAAVRIHLDQARDLYAKAGADLGLAAVQLHYTDLCDRAGDHAGALTHAEHALAHFRRADHVRGQATALTTAGRQHALLGEHEAARDHAERALALLREADDPAGAAAGWDTLAYAQHHLGRHADAVASYERALDLHRDLGDRLREAGTLAHLAATRDAAGDPAAARAAWLRAYEILTDLGHPDAAGVRTRLQAYEPLPDLGPPDAAGVRTRLQAYEALTDLDHADETRLTALDP